MQCHYRYDVPRRGFPGIFDLIFDIPRPGDGSDHFGPFGSFEKNGKITEFRCIFIIVVFESGHHVDYQVIKKSIIRWLP